MGSSRASTARAAVDVTFEELYRGHRADVFRDALRELGNVHDAEDVTQAAFVDAYRAVLGGTQPQSPRAWLLAIAENVRRRRFRTAQRRPRELPLDEDFPLAAELPHEQAHALAEALAALPPEQRRVFALRELAGLSYDEIADEVDSTVGAVQMLLFRARRTLREQLEPPVVARRRTGLLVPMPGWLTSLAARVELAGLTPRVAGATGATALVVLGASVGVPQAPADIPRHSQVGPKPGAAVIAAVSPTVGARLSRPAPGRLAPLSTAPPAIRLSGAKAAQGAPQAPGPGPAPAGPQSVPAVAQPVESGSPAAVATPAIQAERVAGAVAAPVELVEETVQGTVAPVVPPVVAGALPQPPVSLPPPPPALPAVPAVPTPAQVVEAAAGAASAAGADALPLPVPALPPLVTLPPTP
jgi:RNA polymerase sigma-70 factor (ECF subfamily)